MRETAESHAAEERRLADERARKRAEQDAAARSHWEKMAEIGRQARAAEEAKLTPEERGAKRLRQCQGSRMRM